MEKTQTAITKEHVPKPLSDMQRSKLRIAHLNVRSIKNRNHLIQVRELMKDRNYDILALSESWLNSTVTNAEVEIEGFKLTRLDRLGKTGGGVCVYSKSSIKVKCLKNITGISEFGFHQLWMLIQLRKLRSILLCVTYRPDYCPTSTFHDIFMENYIHALTLGKEIIVVGDLNCDLPKPDSPEAICRYQPRSQGFHMRTRPFSYPEPFLRAVRRGALAKSKTGNHKNMVKDIYVIRTISFVVANQMPV